MTRALEAVAGGVDEALGLLRSGDPAVLAGTLVLYGAGATAAATAVLAYRAIVLLLPVALGVPALVSLRRRLAGVVAPGRVLVACAEAD